jgi:hypothetical protein
VGTKEDRVNFTTLGADSIEHLGVDARQRIHLEQAAGHAGLVGRDDDTVTLAVQPRDRL